MLAEVYNRNFLTWFFMLLWTASWPERWLLNLGWRRGAEATERMEGKKEERK